MHTTGNRTVTFDGDEQAALLASVAERKPCFVDRLQRPYDVHVVYQPFFTRHQVIRVSSREEPGERAIHVVLGEQGEMEVLSGHLGVFNALASMDPPGLILDESTAQIYGIMCDAWTASDVLRERPLASFDDIPFSDGAAAVRDDLRAELGDAVGPLHLSGNEDGYLLRKWLVSAGNLVRRELYLGHDGRVSLDEVIVASDLPLSG